VPADKVAALAARHGEAAAGEIVALLHAVLVRDAYRRPAADAVSRLAEDTIARICAAAVAAD
jgi:hypothetical protein